MRFSTIVAMSVLSTSCFAAEMTVDDAARLEQCLTQLGGEFQKIVKTGNAESVVSARHRFKADVRTGIARDLWRIGAAIEGARGELAAVRKQHCGDDNACGSDRKTGLVSQSERDFVDAATEIGKRTVSIDLIEFQAADLDLDSNVDLSAVLQRQCAAVFPWVREK